MRSGGWVRQRGGTRVGVARGGAGCGARRAGAAHRRALPPPAACRAQCARAQLLHALHRAHARWRLVIHSYLPLTLYLQRVAEAAQIFPRDAHVLSRLSYEE
jgi:hypothetical protein